MNKNLILLLSIVAFAGCGSSSSDTKKIDLADYLPSENMSKAYTNVTKIDGKLDNRPYTNTVVLESNTVSITEDSLLDRRISIKDTTIDVEYIADTNRTKVMTRQLNVGDMVSNYLKRDEVETLKIGSQEIGEQQTKVEEKCTLESIVDRYEKFFFEYTNYDDKHDIMKIKCTTKTVVETKIDEQYVNSVAYTNGIVESKEDISYLYMQKGLGTIATINDDCLASTEPDVIDDTLEASKCLGERYEYNLYQPEY